MSDKRWILIKAIENKFSFSWKKCFLEKSETSTSKIKKLICFEKNKFFLVKDPKQTGQIYITHVLFIWNKQMT
jgi:hypothetical protein